jgi:hypothetical protein
MAAGMRGPTQWTAIVSAHSQMSYSPPTYTRADRTVTRPARSDWLTSQRPALFFERNCFTPPLRGWKSMSQLTGTSEPGWKNHDLRSS